MDGILTVIDFETTSRIASEARATEIGLVALDFELNVVDKYQTLIRPPVIANKFAQQISGIYSTMTDQAGVFKDYWPQIYPFLDNRILVAHNANYDLQILINELEGIGEESLPPAICTLKMAQRVFPKAMAGDHTLPSLAKYFGISYEAHEALSDAQATSDLLKIMIEKFPAEKSRILEADKHRQPLKEPKYKGKSPLTRDSLKKARPAQTTEAEPIQPPLKDYAELLNIARSMLQSGKRNIALTGSPSMGKEEFSQMALKVGFQYSRNPVGKRYTALLVVGIEDTGQTKIFDAKQNNVPIVTNEEWITLVDLLEKISK